MRCTSSFACGERLTSGLGKSEKWTKNANHLRRQDSCTGRGAEGTETAKPSRVKTRHRTTLQKLQLTKPSNVVSLQVKHDAKKEATAGRRSKSCAKLQGISDRCVTDSCPVTGEARPAVLRLHHTRKKKQKLVSDHPPVIQRRYPVHSTIYLEWMSVIKVNKFSHTSRIHDVTRTHAPILVFMRSATRHCYKNVRVGKTCAPCAVSASLGRTLTHGPVANHPGPRDRGPQGGRKDRRSWGYWHHGYHQRRSQRSHRRHIQKARVTCATQSHYIDRSRQKRNKQTTLHDMLVHRYLRGRDKFMSSSCEKNVGSVEFVCASISVTSEVCVIALNYQR